MSLVTLLPPRGSTEVCTMEPLRKMEMSVVPPPMSMSATPSSFSSSWSTASAEARGWSTRSSTASSHRSQHLMMFWAEGRAAVTMCTRVSRRTPLMPRGSLISSCPSTMKSWGRT